MSTRTLLEVDVQMLVMTKQDPILCHVLLADQLKLLGIGCWKTQPSVARGMRRYLSQSV